MNGGFIGFARGALASLYDRFTTKGGLLVGTGGSDRAGELVPTVDTRVLTLDSSQPLGMKWAVPGSGGMTNPMTTLADLIVADVGGDPLRLPISSDWLVLMIDPTTHLPVWGLGPRNIALINGDLGGTPGIRFRNAAQGPTDAPLGVAIYQANDDKLYIQLAPTAEGIYIKDSAGTDILYTYFNVGTSTFYWGAKNQIAYSPLDADDVHSFQIHNFNDDCLVNVDSVNNRVGIGFGLDTPNATLHSTGTTIVGVGTAAAADGDLNNGECSIWVTEVATTPTTLNFKVKGSTGTIKSGTVALS
jgi:hypothetical protein